MRRSPIPPQDEREPDDLFFKPLSTWKQIGLGGFLDCAHDYFIINLSVGLTSLCALLAFIVLMNQDREWNIEKWGGNFTGEIACEKLDDGSFVLQKINAGTCFSYILAGLFILLLGLYDRHSWKERDALWRETHLPTLKAAEELELNGGRLSLPRRSSATNGAMQQHTGGNPNSRTANSRASLGRRSVGSFATVQTNKTTFSIEHEEITVRRKFNEYVMGKRGSPSVMIRQPLWSYVFCCALWFLGFTGFLFHANLSETAKKLDDFALWIIVTLMVAYVWTRLASDGLTWKIGSMDCTKLQESPRRSSLVASLFFLILSGGADLLFYIYLDDIADRDYIRAALVIALVLFSIPMFIHFGLRGEKIGSAWTLLVTAMSLLLGAYVINEFDVPGETLCFPNGFQFHALWHVLSAIGVVLVVLFFRSDYFTKDTPLDGENSPRLLNNFTALNPRNIFTTAASSAAMTNTSSEAPIRNAGSRGSEVVEEVMLPEKAKTGKRKSKLGSHAGGSITYRSEITLDKIEEEPVEMWTCVKCDFKDNSMKEKVCSKCGTDRPSMDQFVAIPYTTTALQSAAPSHSSFSVNSSQSPSRTLRRGRQSKQRTLPPSRRPNSAARVVNKPGTASQITNPRVGAVARVSNARANVIRTVNSKGSHASEGRVAVRSRGHERDSRTRTSKPRHSNDRDPQPRTSKPRQVAEKNPAERKSRPRSAERKSRPRSAERKSRPRSAERQKPKKNRDSLEEDVPI